ncbi:MAG: TonB-dependent receptor [Acidobacteriota bacterium]|nr:TonB-dependent receptor [Acidobacteriota bacterium]
MQFIHATRMNRRRCMRGVFLCLSLLAVMAIPAFAQEAGFGSINGTVTDPNNAVVANASVTVIQTDTGIKRSLQTTSTGSYSASFLKPGHYEVIVSASGFVTVDRKDLTVLVGQSLGVDFSLPVAAAHDTVTITSESPLIDTEKISASQEIGQELVGNLPVNGRRYDNFVLLTPNVVPDGTSGLISYRGISGLYNTNLIDGANNNQAFFSEARGRASGAPYVYSIDSIQEFQSDSGSYSAELGQAAGGQINAITKSGTNLMHGDLFYFLRYPDLNALDPYTKAQSYTATSPALKQSYLTQPVHQQHQFGGSIGGPIIKDKLFYFFTYDGFRKVNPILYVSSGPFSSLSQSISSGATTYCPSPLTSSQCLTAVSYLEGNLAGMGGYKLQGEFPRLLRQDIFFPKIDWQLDNKNHLTAEFNWDNFNEPNGYNPSNTSTNGSITQNGTTNFHERFGIVNFNTVLSATAVNQVLFQWSRDLETSSANTPGPSVFISGVASYGMSIALPRPSFPDEHRWQTGDIYSKTFGNNTFKAGVDMNFIHDVAVNLFQGGGSYGYYGTPTGAFTNWVQDVYGVNGGKHYSSFTQVNDPITHVGKDDFWEKVVGAFVDERYKVSPTFQVSAGLRYDVQAVPQPPRPNTSSALASNYTSIIRIGKTQFQPRLGFNWNPRPKTVVRGGYGLFYGLTQGSTYYTMRVENGVFQQQYNAAASTSWAPQNLGVLFTPPGPALAAPFSGAVAPVVQGSTGASLAPLAARGLDPGFKNPYSHSFDVAVDQEFPGRIMLSVGYVGNRGMRLPRFIDTNVQRATETKSYDIVNSSGVTQRTVTLPWYTQRVTYSTASMLAGFSDINSWYHSMVVTVKKPMQHGLELLVNYTWSKTMDEGEVGGPVGTFNGTDVPLDPFNFKAEYARSDLNLKNRFVGNVVWAPTVKTAFRPLNYAAQGWSLSGTFTAQTGFPVTAAMANYPSSALTTPAISGDGGLTGASVSWFNSPTPGRVPQLARNFFPGPGLRNVDARLARDFTITEKTKLQFYVEAFNLMNHTNILGVNTKYSSYVTPLASTSKGYNPACDANSHTNGCIVPYTAADQLGTTTSTSGVLYGARQMQFSAKFLF